MTSFGIEPRYLEAFNPVPQPTTLPRDPLSVGVKIKLSGAILLKGRVTLIH
jgi:hypothetical protein